MLIPIGTEVRTRKPPHANYILIALNVLVFIITDVTGGVWGHEFKDLYMLDAAWPSPYQYITYQFLHGDLTHLLGNMLFLWIFGNAVCDRMGGRVYLLFYLAGGIFAGVVFSSAADNPILGASGAIAAVTTAFLVLYPRVHITMLLFFGIITWFQIPSLIIIVFKIVLWDNILAPSISQHGMAANVAYSAHLGGYLFGFTVAMSMLAIRALPRNQFDLLALWNRWRRRSGLTIPAAETHPRTARPVHAEDLGSTPMGQMQLTPAERLRERILDAAAVGNLEQASALYQQLVADDPRHVLPRRQQLDVANYLNHTQQYVRAVAAYTALLEAYPTSPETTQVKLLIGLILSRYLHRPAEAIQFLREAAEGLAARSHRELAAQEIRDATARLASGTGGSGMPDN